LHLAVAAVHAGKIAQGVIAATQQETTGKGCFTGDEAIESVHGQALALQLGDRQSSPAAFGGRARATGTAQHCQALSFAQPKVIAHQLQGRDLAVPAIEQPRQLLCRLTQDWHFDACEEPAVSRMASAMLALVGHGNLMQQ
jgi:hypothetical protein